MTDSTNQCATSFGAVYDFYMERPRLSKLVARVAWGIDTAPMYERIDEIGDVAPGSVVVDVPCGGGLALRGLDSGQDVRFVGVDLDPGMLARMQEKIDRRGLGQVELIEADMRDLPLPTASADLVLSFSGLHMLRDPERALAEMARILKPGGTLIGTSFVWEGTRRKRFLWKLESRRGIALPPDDAEAVASLLAQAGFCEVSVSGSGFVNFRGVRGG